MSIADAAPEVLLGAPAVLASDIFSFGVLLHEVTAPKYAPCQSIHDRGSRVWLLRRNQAAKLTGNSLQHLKSFRSIGSQLSSVT